MVETRSYPEARSGRTQSTHQTKLDFIKTYHLKPATTPAKLASDPLACKPHPNSPTLPQGNVQYNERDPFGGRAVPARSASR